jgi:NHL repeat-containing protein
LEVAALVGSVAFVLTSSGALASAAASPQPTVQTIVRPGTLDAPAALALDANGDVFVADTGHCRVVEIPAGPGRDYGRTLLQGHATTIAGGRCGSASIGDPTGLAVDVTGDVYVAEANRQRVQVILPSGAIATLAGTGRAGDSGDDGVATSARLDEPTGVAVDRNGDVFIADTANCKVRAVAVADGQILGQAVQRDHIYTVAGTGTCGTAGQGGPVFGAELSDPVAVATDFAGDLLVADRGDHSVLLATVDGGTFYGTAIAAGDIGVVVGGPGSHGPYVADGLSPTSSGSALDDPRAIALGPTGSLVLADGSVRTIRLVPAQSGRAFGRAVTAGDLYTAAGAQPLPSAGRSGHGTRWVLTRMRAPAGVAVTQSGAIVYCDATTGAVVKIG